jgi:hypothetical protein
VRGHDGGAIYRASQDTRVRFERLFWRCVP